jgi:transposase
MSWEVGAMPRASSFSPEVRERAIRMVQEQTPVHGSRWAAVRSIAEKVGRHPETVRSWIRRHEVDTGPRADMTTADEARLEDLGRESRELRRANEILKKAAALFARAAG